MFLYEFRLHIRTTYHDGRVVWKCNSSSAHVEIASKVAVMIWLKDNSSSLDLLIWRDNHQ